MTRLPAVAAAFLAWLTIGAAPAPAPAPARPLLSCTIDYDRRELTLIPDGERLIYRYGTPDHAEITIVGDPSSGNIHYRRRDEGSGDQRFVDAQIRFGNGPYSYIVVYDLHPRAPYAATAHLVVARGTRTLKVRMCSHYALDLTAYDTGRLPTDSDAYRHEYF